jgi:hypothetical protein
MSIAAAFDFEIAPAPARPLLTPLMFAVACVALADWLFYGWEIGISLALFLGVLGVAAVASNGVHATRHTLIVMTVVFIAALLALAEDVSLLSVLVGTLATAMFVMVVTAQQRATWWHYLLEVLAAPFRGPFYLAADLIRLTQRGNYDWLKPASLAGWIVPLGIFTVFVWLFASANPLIEHGLLRIDLRSLIDALDPLRVAFWVLLAGSIWPLMLRRSRRNSVARPAIAEAVVGAPSEPGLFFGKAAMVRSLILFNVLFAVQSGLDLVYLWGGASLPDGMSHAEYAHRGAYPLIATALLAAGFVLVAMRPGGPAEHSRLIRPLVLAWIAQKHPACDLVDLPARSLCRGFLAHLSQARGIHLDGTGGRGANADPDPDHPEEAKFLAGYGQRCDTGARPLRMLLYQRAAFSGILQFSALPGDQRDRTCNRFDVSQVAGPASFACPRCQCANGAGALVDGLGLSARL